MDDNGSSSQDVDFSKLSIEDRISHKNWKARLSGYEELMRLFPQYEDREFQRYAPLVKKFVIDTNAAAQEKGLAATLAFVDYCPQAGKYVENIVAGVATKCLTATRARTKELASDVVLMCVEIERQDVVVEELVKALEQKTPKNVAATIAMIRKCLNQFGYRVIGLKPIVPILARFLEERDLNVREETKQLTIEIYRWIKDALVPQLSSLKPILLQELQTEFDKYKDMKASPERLLRSQQHRQIEDVDAATIATNENDGGGGGGCDGVPSEADSEIDPFDLLEPFDVIAKLPGDFYTLIEAKKWSERKDGLEKLQQLLEANPKLATGSDYSELVKQLRKIIAKDTNIVVVGLAIKCLGQMAHGLRKNFHNHAGPSVPVLLEKFKEKKQNVVQSLRDTIDAVYLSTNLEAISEDVVTSLDNKNPSIRSETALFLTRCFTKTNPHTIQKKLLKTLTTSLIKTLSDSDVIVRESSAEALGTALKAQGDRNMGPLLQGLEQLKMTKIEEYRDKAEVKKFAAPPPSSQSQSTSAKSSAVAKPKTAPVGKKSTLSRQVTQKIVKNVSSESLDDLDLPPPPQSHAPATMKMKSKIGGTTKSRIGSVASASGSGSDNNSTKSVRSGGLTKTSNGSRFGGGTITKGSSISNLRGGSGGGNGVSGESGSASSLTSGSTTSSAKKTGQNDSDSQGPLMNGHLKAKEQRFADEKALKVLRWNFTTPREEFYQILREQMTTAEWQSQLITYCFHPDFKYHIKAIDSIRDFFQKNSSEDNPVVIANLDLILKWIALRFFDTNPSVITKALELLLVIFGICADPYQYQLSDIEANSFLPYLVLKFGDPKDAVRNKVHDIIERIRNIYPAPKIFGHLFTGLQSKNSRQRATCLEEIGQLIEQRGMSIFQQPNSLTMIKDLAKFIAERDNGVRNGALACIVQVYFLEGERVFKLIGSLSDKDMSLVEERIKRASKNRPPPPANSAQTTHSNHTSEPTQSNGTSGLPTLSGRIGGARNGGSGLATPTDFEGSKMASPSNLPFDGATLTKSPRSSLSNSLLRRGQSGGNFTSSSRLRAQQQQQQGGLKFSTPPPPLPLPSQPFTTDTETESETMMIDPRNGVDHHPGILSSTATESNVSNNRLTSGTSESSDVYTTDDDNNDNELQQRIKQALNLPESIRYRPTNRASSSTATVRSSSSDSSRSNGHYITPIRMNGGGMNHGSPNSSPSNLNSELQQKFNQLFQLLGSTDLQQAIEAAELLNVAMKDLEKNQRYFERKIDQLIILCNKQFRLFLSKHYPSEQQQQQQAIDENRDTELDNNNKDSDDRLIAERRERAILLFRTITNLLNKVFRSPLGKLISRDTVRELITHLLSYFAGMRHIQTVFNSTNCLIGIIMAGADATNLFAALIRMLHDYVGSPSVEQSDKYLNLTIKFLWRITKTLEERYYEHLNIDQILYESHLFFKSYPKSWWQLNRKDDLPLRTIKTLIFFIVSLKGDSILDHFTLIQNKDESELSFYVQKALRQKFDKSTGSTNNNNNNSTTSKSSTLKNDSKNSKLDMNSPSRSFDNNSSNATNGNGGNVKENQNQSPSPQQSSKQQRRIPELSPRTDFPLRLRQIHNAESSANGGMVSTIPIVETKEDFQIYCDHTAKKLQINELSYERFRNNYQQSQHNQQQQQTRIRNIEDAKRAVELAKQRLDHLKTYLNNDNNNQITRPSSSNHH
ncbi:msps cytoskeleton-associated protein 5 [Dermatophagoides farinae]|uniref:msps cytoskeleton-associated protein 5 n=1 Tax=Dermatophagoides farinae TaxID=6954 RepID=UPI003F5EE0F3